MSTCNKIKEKNKKDEPTARSLRKGVPAYYKCKNSPDKFCYMCGGIVFKS